MAIEQPFDEPWQARAFALTVSLHDRGLFAWSEWNEALAAEIAVDPCRSYYDAWLSALQILAADRAGLSWTEIGRAQADWLLAAEHTPHGEAITLDAIPAHRTSTDDVAETRVHDGPVASELTPVNRLDVEHGS